MADQPNILLVMSDQHNRRVMGCAGDDVIRTPNLDRLAQNGVRFTSCYTPSPLCLPARMSFLTSRYPSDQRVWTNSCILDSNIPTFAHQLSLAGYETVLTGRMHFVGHDQHHGFEKRQVGSLTAQFPGGPGPDLGEIPLDSTGQSRLAVEVSGRGRTAYQVYDQQVTDEAIRFMNERDDRRPFAMVVGYILPHCPFISRVDLYDQYIDKVGVPEVPEGHFESVHPFVQQSRQHRGITDLKDTEIRSARAGYYGIVSMLDENVGRIMDALEKSGLDRNTIVIYASDHGEMAGDHGMWWKSSFYEGSAGVPLIVSCPGRFGQGRTVDRVTSLVDIGPTLLDLAGARPLPRSRGTSLRDFLQGDSDQVPGWPDETFSEHCPNRGDRASCMIRSGPWKLNHFHGYETVQLFNIEDDPDEWHDLGQDPAHADIRDELRGRLLARWDGDAVERECERLCRDVEILDDWGRTVQPGSPGLWRAPPGSNVFPGE
jgi:choline-sulfatase